MRVHFGGSLRGLKLHPDNYIQINDSIKNLGHDLLRDWVTEETKGMTASIGIMYEYTSNAIKNADVVVLENSLSSTSVGQQLMLALQNNLPVLLLVDESISESKAKEGIFISSNLSKLVQRKKYNKKNITRILNNFFKKSESEFSESRFNLVIDKKLDKYLKELARKNNSSKSAEIRRLIVERMLTEKST
jgi:hypothetical protein